MAEQGVVLKDESDIALLHRQSERVLAVEGHKPVGRLVEAREDAQERRLAGAGRTEQCQEFTRANVEGDILDGEAVAVALHDMFHLHIDGLVPFRGRWGEPIAFAVQRMGLVDSHVCSLLAVKRS